MVKEEGLAGAPRRAELARDSKSDRLSPLLKGPPSGCRTGWGLVDPVLAAGAAQQLTGTEGATLPFWSPDSRQVGFFQASKLKSVDPGSGAVQVLCDAPGGFGGAWNDLGTIIFAFGGSNGPSDIRSNSILKISASGGEPQLVTKDNAPKTRRSFERLLKYQLETSGA
jgi:hypothetical protein